MPEDKNNNFPNPQAAVNKAKSANITKKPKPLVEGINTPVSQPAPKANKLTPAEEILIKNVDTNPEPTPTPVIKPPSPKITVISEEKPKKNRAGLTTLVMVLILLILGSVYYFWRNYKSFNGNKLGLSSLTGSKPAKQNLNTQTAPKTANSNLPAGLNTASTTVTAEEVGKNPKDLFAPAVAVKTLKVKDTPTGYLNVRQLPTTSSKILTRVKPGETYPYTETKNGWYKINLKGSSAGWVIGTYIQKQ